MQETRPSTTGKAGLAARRTPAAVIAARRLAPGIRWVSLGVAVVSAWALLRLLPVDGAVGALERWLGQRGVWGPVVYGLIYVVAGLLMVPGSLLTITSGFLFGLVWGTLTAWLASTVAVAVGFLIARHLARDALARRLGRYPAFAAIDRAIGVSGWRIVALVRLSIAAPYNLQNYLYGLTPIGFRATVVTNSLAMLPGMFLYAYIGHVSHEGLGAASAGRSPDAGRWALLVIGLVATAALAAYLARLARRAIREQAATGGAEPAVTPEFPDDRRGAGWPWLTTLVAALALALGLAAAYAYRAREAAPPTRFRQPLPANTRASLECPMTALRSRRQAPRPRPAAQGVSVAAGAAARAARRKPADRGPRRVSPLPATRLVPARRECSE